MKYFNIIAFTYCLIFLSGCDTWIMPVDAEQTFVVTKEHGIQMSYKGLFTDYCDEITALLESKRQPHQSAPPTAKQCSQKIFDSVNVIFGDKEVIGAISQTSVGEFKIEYRATLAPDNAAFGGGLPCIRPSVECGGVKIASMADFHESDSGLEIIGNDRAYSELRGALKGREAGSDDPEDFNKLFQRIRSKALRFHMRLVVQTDDYVISHNAADVKPLANGLTEYRWELDPDSPVPMLKAVHDETLGKSMSLDEKLAEPGNRCRDLIGESCKCGPFELVDAAGKPLKMQAYEMHVGDRIVKGRSGLDGTINAELTELTGECSVKLIDSKRGKN